MNGKRNLVLAAAAGIVTCGIVAGGLKAQSASAPGTAAQSATPAGPKLAEEQFKNIKVLKGVPADQVFPAMQFITISLGVECEFCHVQGAGGRMEFDKDDKKQKETARKMMEMMFAINKDNFDGHREVTCNTCHRGSPDPVGTPPVMSEELKTEAKAAPAEAKKESGDAKEPAGPPADQLLEKYVQALGGAAAIDKITTRVAKGTIEFGDKSFPIELYSKDPEKRISFTHMPEGDNVTAFNGQEGWLGTVGRPMREMHGGDLDGAAIDADLHLATHLPRIFTKLSTRGTEKIGDHDVYEVVGQREDKPPLRLYFDKESGLLVRLVRFSETPLGRLPTQIDYADYRVADGVKVPFRWTLARPNGRFTIQVTELKQNVPVDDAKFAKPPAPPPPVPGAPQGLSAQPH
jgi:photosynthetic reaction center cytochrome c subunit